MKSTIKLFKALPVTNKKTKEASEKLLKETLSRGFVFAPEVVANYSEQELLDYTKDLGLTPEQLNNSFHKSWAKVRDASIEQLFMEQIIHYFTTYGFKELGIYSESSVYIPNEKLEIPDWEENVTLTVIKGYTKEELKEKLLKLLSGIALSEDTIQDVIDVAMFVDINEDEVETIKNREVKIAMYDYLNIVPKNPVEFLRYVVFKTTEKTLLIKSPEFIQEIKGANHLSVTRMFKKYDLNKLAEIFYRYKPIFLAYRSNKQMKQIINQIRRLAVKNHKPLPEDFLNSITANLKKGEKIDKKKLEEELGKVNIYRKIRLAYALKFRTKDAQSILYRIRNGKGFAKEFKFGGNAKSVLDTVLKSIVDSLDVKDKKIYIPEHINYSLPATEKQFTGYFPSGTYVSIPKDMVFGVHWNNVNNRSIDLDLSLIDKDSQKLGWDAGYRSDDRKILFSGDITDAPKPKGASEFFYVAKQADQSAIMLVNYYNYDSDTPAPFDIIVAEEEVKNLDKNFTVDPNAVLSVAGSKMDKRQKILGLLVTTASECRFYYAETYLGNSISSSGSEFAKNARQYLFDYYQNTIELKDLLEKAGAEMIDKEARNELVKEEEEFIDLSPEKLEKDTILNLLDS